MDKNGLLTAADKLLFTLQLFQVQGTPSPNSPAAVDFLFGYTGQQYDGETGLDFYKARYYDPATGRFLSEDPAGLSGGDVNFYRYVGNNPVNATDPTGMFMRSIGGNSNFYDFDMNRAGTFGGLGSFAGPAGLNDSFLGGSGGGGSSASSVVYGGIGGFAGFTGGGSSSYVGSFNNYTGGYTPEGFSGWASGGGFSSGGGGSSSYSGGSSSGGGYQSTLRADLPLADLPPFLVAIDRGEALAAALQADRNRAAVEPLYAPYRQQGNPDLPLVVRVQSTGKIASGALTTVGGAIFAGATAETGVGLAAGVGAAFYGADQFTTGLHEFLSGERQRTLTNQAIANTTGSQTAADYSELGISVVSGFIGGRGLSSPGTPSANPSSPLQTATYAQLSYDEMFSDTGRTIYSNLGGGKVNTIDDLAAALKSGDISPSQLPVDYVRRADGIRILNTRTGQALERAGIDRSLWNGIDRTESVLHQYLLQGQLERNGWPVGGVAQPKSTGF